jgi:hemoglobin
MLNPDRALYYRLGGYDAIAAFCDELLSRLTKDPTLAVYWKGKCDDSMRKDRQLLVDFLCMIAGGPVNYSGRDMKTAHTGLGINEAEWNIFAQHAIAVLNDLGVSEQEREEVLSLAAGFKSDVVEMAAHRKATH